MVCQPVQRHRCARRAWSIAAAVSGAFAAAPARRTMIPGVQKPHWLAPQAVNARAQRSASGRPSTVVTARPATRRAGVTQATRACPSTRTVQQPHWPCGLQPSFGDRMPRRSRRASRSEQPSSATSTARPSTTKRSRPGMARRLGDRSPTGPAHPVWWTPSDVQRRHTSTRGPRRGLTGCQPRRAGPPVPSPRAPAVAPLVPAGIGRRAHVGRVRERGILERRRPGRW